MLVLGAVQLLREEVPLMVSSSCLVNSRVAVFVRILVGGGFVRQAEGDAVNTRQVAHGVRVSLSDGVDRRPVVPHQHHIDWLPDT